MKQKIEKAGFKRSYKIDILRSLPLDKILLESKPRKITGRRFTICINEANSSGSTVDQRQQNGIQRRNSMFHGTRYNFSDSSGDTSQIINSIENLRLHGNKD